MSANINSIDYINQWSAFFSKCRSYIQQATNIFGRMLLTPRLQEGIYTTQWYKPKETSNIVNFKVFAKVNKGEGRPGPGKGGGLPYERDGDARHLA